MLLSRDRETVRTLIDAIDTPVFIIDVNPDGDFQYFAVNRREVTDTRIRAAEFEGLKPDDILPPADAVRIRSDYQACVDSRSPFKTTDFRDGPSGRRWVNKTLVPIFDRNGRVVRIIGTTIAIDGAAPDSPANTNARPASMSDGFIAQVRRCVTKALPDGSLKLPDIARDMGASPRTLQRRLAEHETNYREVVDEVRQRLAMIYLREGRASLKEVAFLLGYSEVSAFNHAFRRWTGAVPSAYREPLGPPELGTSTVH